MFWANAIVCLIVSAGDPGPPEMQVIAQGEGWHLPAISPDGKWVVAHRRPRPEPGEKESHSEVSIWNIADLSQVTKRTGGSERETRRDADSNTNGGGLRPHRTIDLRDYDCDSSSDLVSFADDGSGRVVVITDEVNRNGYLLPGAKRKDKIVTADEAQAAKAAGRKVTRFQRPVTLFLDPENLQELSRWVDDTKRSTHGFRRDYCWFPPAKTAIGFTHDGVSLFDDATGEEYERLLFEKEFRG